MVAALIFFEVQLPDVSPEYSFGSNIVFFLLINVNIILLGLLVFLVVRNLVKLVVERRRRMLGSRLQARLVLAFVATFARSERIAVHHCRRFAAALLRSLVRFQSRKRAARFLGNRPDLLPKFRQQRDFLCAPA